MLKTVAPQPGDGNGTVTLINTGTGINGGPITTTGTISLANTAVGVGTYGNATAVSSFVVDQQGRLTSASNVSISIAPSQINATIPNSGLANSSTTLGNTALTLGSTVSAVGNLTLNKSTMTSGQYTGTVFGFLPQIGTTIADTTYQPIVGANLAIETTDLYTVPTGKKAAISTIWRLYNPSAGSIDVYLAIKVSGTYYRWSVTTTLAAGVGATPAAPTNVIVLNAGESVAVTTATTAGANVRMTAWEFDSTETRIATARILGLSNGNNTLFTVPANKTAQLIGANPSAQSGNIGIVNDSGGALNYYINAVPSGGSVSTQNQLYPATSLADKGLVGMLPGSTFTAGDFLNVNTSAGTAGQWAYVTYYLIP